MGFSDNVIATARVDGKPLTELETKSRTQEDRMNKTEALYTIELEAQRGAGEITRWAFESLKFRLANRTWYTPDFAAWLTSGGVRVVEVKGGFIRDDAAVKFKVAREMYPEFEWVCMQRTKAGWRQVLT